MGGLLISCGFSGVKAVAPHPMSSQRYRDACSGRSRVPRRDDSTNRIAGLDGHEWRAKRPTFMANGDTHSVKSDRGRRRPFLAGRTIGRTLTLNSVSGAETVLARR